MARIDAFDEARARRNLSGYSLEKNATFENVTYAGRTIRFPVVYSEQFRMSADFPISSSKANDLLPSNRLELIEVKPGTTILSVMAFEYKAIHGMRPYNEFGTFIAVNYRKSDGSLGEPGAYCLHLPVTTEEARWGGVYIYGFPKIVAEIDFVHRGNSSTCIVWHDGKTIAELTVSRIDPKAQSGRGLCYTFKDGEILKTLVETEGLVGAGNEKSGATLELGDHKFGKDLSHLNLGRDALECSYVPKMYSLLHKPSEHLQA